VYSYNVSVDDSIINKGGSVKTWIRNNVRRIQDGMIGLFSGFIVTNQDIGLLMSMLVCALFLGIIAHVIGIK